MPPGDGIHRNAVFSRCRTWRYTLTRTWDETRPSLLFVLLNPSTADAQRDDPTKRRGMGFARRWGYGRVVFVNLFAYRSTDPKALRQAADPIGPRNDFYIKREAAVADRIVCAWGVHGTWMDRDRAVMDLLPRPLYCLGLTKAGQPRHPLYLPADTRCRRFAPSNSS